MLDLATLNYNIKKLFVSVGEKPTIIVGLSGGPDSVFLLHLLKQLRDAGSCTLIAAHLNHGWRAEAPDDVAWCRTLCEKLNIPFIAGHASDYPVDKKYLGSAEAIGRKQRQLFFASIKKQYNAHVIALGHHQDDQIETFFIRLARGSSLSGLHGMDPYDGTYLRPLLNNSKQAIVDYLDQHKIAYLTDATNMQDTYLRNRLRNYLIPALAQCDARFSASIINTIEQLKAENHFLETLTVQTFIKLFENQKNASLPAFLALDSILQRRIIMHWLITEQVAFTPSTALIEEILRFLSSPRGGTHAISTTHRLVKQKSRIWLENTVG